MVAVRCGWVHGGCRKNKGEIDEKRKQKDKEKGLIVPHHLRSRNTTSTLNIAIRIVN